ncbi:hypothetical protein ZEAMMB73_Zm00001d011290 [Zea mays]|uniref:Uncharacterized protein n=1 Tax=Zea mays TaxID=4577 RepID=K7V716_MAIZE|nr:hypothetical protein ZEAMMB73_Zm00001d011290 [Zea mays]
MDPVGPPLPTVPALQLQRRRHGETRSCRVPAEGNGAQQLRDGGFHPAVRRGQQQHPRPRSGAQEEEEVLLARSRTRGEPSVVFPVPSEDCVAGFVEVEAAHMPWEDYAERLRGGGTDLRVRTDAIDWIWKVGRSPRSMQSSLISRVCVPIPSIRAMNLTVLPLDRFTRTKEGKSWTTQLLSVACLSLAAKMEETYVPPSLDLQLVLPIFNGAAYIYEAHVRRYFKISSYVSPSYSEHHRRVLQMTSLDACRSVKRFIDTHGPDALDRIIRAAEQEAKRT